MANLTLVIEDTLRRAGRRVVVIDGGGHGRRSRDGRPLARHR